MLSENAKMILTERLSKVGTFSDFTNRISSLLLVLTAFVSLYAFFEVGFELVQEPGGIWIMLSIVLFVPFLNFLFIIMYIRNEKKYILKDLSEQRVFTYKVKPLRKKVIKNQRNPKFYIILSNGEEIPISKDVYDAIGPNKVIELTRASVSNIPISCKVLGDNFE